MDTLRDGCYLNDTDDHTALVHGYYYSFDKVAAEEGLQGLVAPDGGLYRRSPDGARYRVSGDCLSSWCWSYTESGIDRPDLVQKVAKHYLKHAMGLTSSQEPQGKVSTRCSNGGLNYAPDGAGGLAQPAFGPQFYTSAAILALACKTSKWYARPLWEAAYLFNFILFGGWMWAVEPFLHTKKDHIYYAQHITMINLYTIIKARGNMPWYKRPMKRIFDLTFPRVNPVFYVLLAEATGYRSAVESIDAGNIILSIHKAHGFIGQRDPTSPTYHEEIKGAHFSPISFVAKYLLKNR
jgi:hypothetical protein